MKKRLLFHLLLLMGLSAAAQKKTSTKSEDPRDAMDLSGLQFRSVGPAITSGRIADFAVDPNNPKAYYVATASGGVWKTRNAGTTYTPIFDGEGSYSIGCVSLDPNNGNVVWVGTGENNNQRSVAYGDGVYKSLDGGASWENVGLQNSEHIGRILIHPEDSDTVFVAAIGPLWSPGGDRGVYKTTDGGKSWKAVLALDEHTGVNDIVMDPNDPDILYATAFQRRRHVFTYLGGGPESGIYKTTDGGANWQKINTGLPKVDLGRIGLAIAPSNPEILYAIVEAAQGKGGFYRSTNGGASWQKRGSYVSSGNYYQEIVVDPLNADVIYGMDTWMQVSRDGGKTFKNLGEDAKHVDNHCLWIDPRDTEHMLAGCDGGIYETFDGAATWQYKANLPITQFYKVAVDNSEPFYFIYGGTQDNFSMGGPSRTTSGNGIANSQWFMTHGGDGFESAIDPDDPNIVYAQSQYGYLVRYDKQSGQELGIQPQPRKNEKAYRWNWDAPLQVSTHRPGRIYFAANKVFRSDDRGHRWEVISEDLTAQINRNALEVMGQVWSTDAVAKNRSTSPYGTIVAFSESPKNENLLYAGTDDGLIQVTEDGGNQWRKIQGIKGVPARTYVNAVLASQHNENRVYAAFNHHKYGDFRPYIYRSNDKGRTWTAISTNLPDRGSVYAIAEDFVDPDLLFAGTEFGLFFSNNGGATWTPLKAGLPTIAVRDIAIQQREGDLVLGTFGRGFYVLDDYSSLRGLSDLEKEEAALFPIRDALSFEYNYPLGLPGKSFQGDSYYLGDNLGAEALITYYLRNAIKSKKEQRLEREKTTQDDPYPDYEALSAEKSEETPYLLFSITDAQGKLVRKLTAKPKKGLQRITWDLRFPSTDPVRLKPPAFYNPFSGPKTGVLVPPGTYTVQLSKFVDGTFTALSQPVSFTVKPLENTVLPAKNPEALARFQDEMMEVARVVQGAQNSIKGIYDELKYIKKAIGLTPMAQSELTAQYLAIRKKLDGINRGFNGDAVAAQLDMDQPMSLAERLGNIQYAMFHSTAETTQTNAMSLEIVKERFAPLRLELRGLINKDLKALQDRLEQAGAPYTPNRIIAP